MKDKNLENEYMKYMFLYASIEWKDVEYKILKYEQLMIGYKNAKKFCPEEKNMIDSWINILEKKIKNIYEEKQKKDFYEQKIKKIKRKMNMIKNINL